MEPIKINIDEISEFELNLAKNDRAIAFAEQIMKFSPEDRAQRLKNLKIKIQNGEATLFEEKVLVKLLEEQAAEKITRIRQDLPALAKTLNNRTGGRPAPTPASSPSPSPPANQSPSGGEYPSALLEFLATQKPPPPTVTKSSAKSKSKSGVLSSPAEKRRVFSQRDIAVGVVLLFLLVAGFWYTISSEETPPAPATFDQQPAGETAVSNVPDETLQAIRTEFDEALQQLRFGVFDTGKAQLLTITQQYPATPFAEEAYLAIADAYRQRQNNPDEALKYYQFFTEQYPNSPNIGVVHLKMGFAYEELGDSGSAETMYRLILKQYGDKSRVGQLAHERLQSLKKQE